MADPLTGSGTTPPQPSPTMTMAGDISGEQYYSENGSSDHEMRDVEDADIAQSTVFCLPHCAPPVSVVCFSGVLAIRGCGYIRHSLGTDRSDQCQLSTTLRDCRMSQVGGPLSIRV